MELTSRTYAAVLALLAHLAIQGSGVAGEAGFTLLAWMKLPGLAVARLDPRVAAANDLHRLPQESDDERSQESED